MQDNTYTDGPEREFSFFDDDEPEVFIDYVCVDCGCIDPNVVRLVTVR